VNKNYDFIIIGQGIAGSVLSWYLLEKKLNFLIINDSTKLSASSTALGVYNPITGKRIAKTWKAKKISTDYSMTIELLMIDRLNQN